MKNNYSKFPYDSYLKSLVEVSKSLMPISKTLSEIAFDTSALTGATEMLNRQMFGMWKGYEAVDVSKAALAVMKAAYIPLGLSDDTLQSMESFQEIGRRFSSISMVDEYSKSLDSIQSLAKTLMSFDSIDRSSSLQILEESMKCFGEELIPEQVMQLRSIDYGKILSETMEANGSLKDAVDAAYASLPEENSSETEELETEFANEQEIHDAVQEQINNPVGFQETVANWAEGKKKKYYIIYGFLWLFAQIFIMPYLQEQGLILTTRFVNSVNVKELPQKGAEVICQLKADIQAMVIEDTSYYYKVSFIDEDGVQREGYVAKRNLKRIEEPETEESEEEVSAEE